jgi:hypothetical protein
VRARHDEGRTGAEAGCPGGGVAQDCRPVGHGVGVFFAHGRLPGLFRQDPFRAGQPRPEFEASSGRSSWASRSSSRAASASAWRRRRSRLALDGAFGAVGSVLRGTSQDLVPRVGLRIAIAQIDRSSERVDPPVETASLAGEDARIAEGVGEQRAALIGSEKTHGEVVRVAAAQCPELLLSPLDRNAH